MTDVYFNRTKRMWSLRENGRVTGHADRVILKGATFHVQPGGRDRVRATGKKTVHAWVRGTVMPEDAAFGMAGNRIVYDPRYHDTFIHISNYQGGYQEVRKPIFEAEWVLFKEDGTVWWAYPHCKYDDELLARIDYHLALTRPQEANHA